MTSDQRVFYGIGVGPGDPGLITLKAREILGQVPRILAAYSTKNDYSLAEKVVKSHFPEASVERMDFPMSRDQDALLSAWENNARRVLEILDSNQDAAFVTLGDPLIYSTFSYLLRTVKRLRPTASIVTIPGITSFQASAALCNTPLVEAEETLHVISAAKGSSILRRVIDNSDNVVMLKTYRHFDDICDALEELDLLECTASISRCGLEGEVVQEDVRSAKGKKVPYLSLMIVKKKGTSLWE